MAHEIVTYRDRHAIIHDMDFWTIRHFLFSEAEASDDRDLAVFIQGWNWIGPGVYVGNDFDAYFDGDPTRENAFVKLLDGTRTRIESFGDVVPVVYLAANVNLPGAYFTDAQSVPRLVQQLSTLKELFTAARPAV